MDDLLLQVLPVSLQFQIARFDLHEHAVELGGQCAEFIAIEDFGPDRIVTLGRNSLGSLDQAKDRPRDWLLEARGQHKSQGDRHQQSRYEVECICTHSRMQSLQVGFEVKRANFLPGKLDFSKQNQVSILELCTFRLQWRRYKASIF